MNAVFLIEIHLILIANDFHSVSTLVSISNKTFFVCNVWKIPWQTVGIGRLDSKIDRKSFGLEDISSEVDCSKKKLNILF